MTVESIGKLYETFQTLSAKQQWEFVLKYRNDINPLTLDNDNTTFCFKEDEECEYLFCLEDDAGNRSGTSIILNMLGIPNEYA